MSTMAFKKFQVFASVLDICGKCFQLFLDILFNLDDAKVHLVLHMLQ
jgi:hypothetical protein